MEKAYWKQVGSQPQGAAYVSAGLGMGEVLNMAAEMQAYTLTDRATYSRLQGEDRPCRLLVEGDQKMFNPYGIIAVNPARHKGANYKGAMQLTEWMTSDEGQARIAAFRPEASSCSFPASRR